jgi:hypothetical protein
MPAVEHTACHQRHKERRAKAARRSLAFSSPRPPLLRDSTKESMILLLKKPSDSDFVATRGSVADAFFGASPVVASALGIRLGATPRGRFHPNIYLSALPRKADISTLLGIGHFYFALTWGCLDMEFGFFARASHIVVREAAISSRTRATSPGGSAARVIWRPITT